jgi:hypothetical protein
MFTTMAELPDEPLMEEKSTPRKDFSIASWAWGELLASALAAPARPQRQAHREATQRRIYFGIAEVTPTGVVKGELLVRGVAMGTRRPSPLSTGEDLEARRVPRGPDEALHLQLRAADARTISEGFNPVPRTGVTERTISAARGVGTELLTNWSGESGRERGRASQAATLQDCRRRGTGLRTAQVESPAAKGLRTRQWLPDEVGPRSCSRAMRMTSTVSVIRCVTREKLSKCYSGMSLREVF